MQTFLSAWNSFLNAWYAVLHHPEFANGNDWLLCFLTVCAAIILYVSTLKYMQA